MRRVRPYNKDYKNVLAPNRLTRRENHADLTAMHVDFNPRLPLAKIAELRDLARKADKRDHDAVRDFG